MAKKTKSKPKAKPAKGKGAKPTKKAAVKKVKKAKAVVKKSKKAVAKPVAKKAAKKPVTAAKRVVKKAVKPVVKPSKAEKPAKKPVEKPVKVEQIKAQRPVMDEDVPTGPGRRPKVKAPVVPKKKFIREIIPLKMDIPTPGELAAATGKKSKPEPKGKFQIEYVVHASANILYEFLTTPSGLSEWFCDDVNVRGGVYSFFWDGSQQQAKLIGYKEPQYIRFQWVEKNDGSYFEFKIEKDELTGDISLIVTDFADEAEQTTSKLLWDAQVNKLLHVLGSY